ncbi:MAG: hypothetical protein JWM30_4064 [Burkholderia sp.]|nr:hypothetical protein [Burkholderia sp.]
MNIDARLPDFDTLSRLYKEDPAAFESFRRHLLRQAVDEAPRRHRPALEELLLCIEANRQRAATPTDAAVGAFQMMRQSVSQLNAAWQLGLQSLAQLQSDALLKKLRAG